MSSLAPDAVAAPESAAAPPLAPLREQGRTFVRRILPVGLLGYVLASAGVVMADRRYGWQPLARAFRRWDSGYYLSIARSGYKIPPMALHGYVHRSDAAFFPGYPLVIRALATVMTPFGATFADAGWLVNGGSGLAALAVIVAIARRYWSEPAAVRCAQAAALFPGSAVLVFTYSEGLFLLLASGTVLAGLQRRWLAAGLLAAGAGFVRANGLYLTAWLAVMAVHAVWRRREWIALAAPVLAPVGFVSFMLFLWRTTHRPDAWFAVERYGWDQRDDFGAETWRLLTGPHPWSIPLVVVEVVGTAYLLCVLALALARRVRLPGPLLGYTAVMVLPLLLSSRLGLRPRFLLPAFPLQMLVGVGLRRWWFLGYCVLAAAGMVAAGYYFAGPYAA